MCLMCVQMNFPANVLTSSGSRSRLKGSNRAMKQSKPVYIKSYYEDKQTAVVSNLQNHMQLIVLSAAVVPKHCYFDARTVGRVLGWHLAYKKLTVYWVGQ